MRYFLCTNAGRPIIAGGRSFTFEPVSNWGGCWLGVLATEDDSAANILSQCANEGIDEIDQAHYDRQKKKQSVVSSNSIVSPNQPKLAMVPQVVHPAERAIEHTSGANVDILTPVTLLGTRNQPPREPLLDGGGITPRRK